MHTWMMVTDSAQDLKWVAERIVVTGVSGDLATCALGYADRIRTGGT